MFGLFKKKNATREVDTSNDDYVEYEEVVPVGNADLATLSPGLSLENASEFGNNVITQFDTALTTVNSIGTTIKDTVQIIANVKYEIAKLDHDLDMFIADSNTRLEKFKTAMPVLEKQLTLISGRIDNITNQMLSNIMDPKDPNSVQKHSMMMDMLSSANDSFNNMLVKLITI